MCFSYAYPCVQATARTAGGYASISPVNTRQNCATWCRSRPRIVGGWGGRTRSACTGADSDARNLCSSIRLCGWTDRVTHRCVAALYSLIHIDAYSTFIHIFYLKLAPLSAGSGIAMPPQRRAGATPCQGAGTASLPGDAALQGPESPAGVRGSAPKFTLILPALQICHTESPRFPSFKGGQRCAAVRP